MRRVSEANARRIGGIASGVSRGSQGESTAIRAAGGRAYRSPLSARPT